jgi:DNA-binding transcriptional MerR regulator
MNQQQFDTESVLNEDLEMAGLADHTVHTAPTPTEAEAAQEGEIGSAIEFQMSDEAILEPDVASAHSEELEMRPPTLPIVEVKPALGDILIAEIESIPSKMAFKIGEVADLVGVKQYVLRYWESEFDALKPKKSKNNQRVYLRRDVETALLIKKLLYTDRFSIEGARAALRQLKSQVREERDWKSVAQTQESTIQKVHGLLEDIRRLREILA